MNNGYKRFAIMALSAFIVALVALACAGEKAEKPGQPPKAPDTGGNAQAKSPTTLKTAERGKGLLESPEIPFELDKTYTYNIFWQDKKTGTAEISFKAVGDEGYRADCTQYVYELESGNLVAEIQVGYALEKNLSPKMYVQKMSDANGSVRDTRSIDFTGDEIATQSKLDPLDEGEGRFNYIQKAGDEIWAYDFQNIAGLVVVTACIDPAATKTGFYIFMIDEERVSKLDLEYKGDEPLVLKGDQSTVMARKYNCLMDSIPFGTIYLTPDRRLVAQMIEPSGQYIELQIPVEQPPATE